MKKYITIGVIFCLLVAGFALYVFWDVQKMSDSEIGVDSFTKCAGLNSSQVKEVIPDTFCTTKSGKTFKETASFYGEDSQDSSASAK